MKIIICGAGPITDELLKRVGANWEITLIEKAEAKLTPFPTRFPSVVRVIGGDASSPVVLEKAGLAQQHCVLAMTNDDSVNLAIVRFAREAGVKNVLAVVRDSEFLPEFRKLDVWTIAVASDAARKAYQFLKDPRTRIIDLGEGEGELLELLVENRDLSRLQDVFTRQDSQWRVAGVVRDNILLFPEDLEAVEEGDRLLVLGRGELYTTFSNRLVDNRPHFPRTYGREMILGVGNEPSLDVAELLNEAFYIAQRTHTEQIKAVCAKKSADLRETLSRWSESLQIDILEDEGDLNRQLISVAQKADAGIVIVPYTGGSFLGSIFGSNFMKMARKLPCPLLLAKFSAPYDRLLVPFKGSLGDQRSLEIAMDLGRQLDATVSAVIVVEPSYLRGESSSTEQWENEMLRRVRELSRVHQITVEEHVLEGNPVKEVLALAGDRHLMVICADEVGSGLFSIDVPGLTADRSPCSVLVVS